MNIEARVVPATVYVAEDAATPRWQFLVILANRSESEWTLADFRLSGVFSGADGESVAEAVPTKGNPAEWGFRLKPNELGGVSVLDRFAPDRTPTSMRAEFELKNSDGRTFRDSVETQLVPRSTVALDFPLDGRWAAENARPDRHGLGIAFAFDFVAEADRPVHEHPDGRQWQAHEFASFGQPLYSPLDGVVAAAESGQPDLACTPGGPSTFEKGAPPGQPQMVLCGNYVLILGENGICVLMAHIQQGSLLVHAGQRVAAGERIGSVGNSGNTTGAHLHIEVLDTVPDLAQIGTLKSRESGVPFGFHDLAGADGKDSRGAIGVPGKDEIVERRETRSAA